jgi:hypothetical protein
MRVTCTAYFIPLDLIIVRVLGVREYIQKFPVWVDNEINNSNNKHSLRSNTKGYGGKTY